MRRTLTFCIALWMGLVGCDREQNEPAEPPETSEEETSKEDTSGCADSQAVARMQSVAHVVEPWLQDTVRNQVIGADPPGWFTVAFESALPDLRARAVPGVNSDALWERLKASPIVQARWEDDPSYMIFAELDVLWPAVLSPPSSPSESVEPSETPGTVESLESQWVHTGVWADRDFVVEARVIHGEAGVVSLNPMDPNGWYLGLRAATDWDSAIAQWAAAVPEGMQFHEAVNSVAFPMTWTYDGYGPSWSAYGIEPTDLPLITNSHSVTDLLGRAWFVPGELDLQFFGEVMASSSSTIYDLTMVVEMTADGTGEHGPIVPLTITGVVRDIEVRCDFDEAFELNSRGFMDGDVICRVRGENEGEDTVFTLAYRPSGVGGGIKYWCPIED